MSVPRRFVIASIAALAHWSALADQLERISPQAAYEEIARSGTLQRLQIDGDLDVAKMQAPPGAKRIVLQAVQLEGRLYSSAGGPPVALWINNKSVVRDIDLRGTRWSAPFVVESSTIKDRARFDDAQFDALFVLHGSTFTGQTNFPRARFAGPVEIMWSTFQPAPPLRASVNFTDARFAAPARFDNSDFATGVRFDTTRFAADASFIRLKATGRASWHNVIFSGDAEFRFCRLTQADADFGHAEQMSVFMHLADFRGCEMRSLRLDYADIRGDALLVNVRVAPGELTLRNASLRGARNDFSGLQVAGKLDLTGARIANLQMRWSEIGPAVLRSKPGSDVLRPLYRRLEELGQDDEALQASAVLASRVMDERLAAGSWADNLFLRIERVVWGCATGYGTRLGRIVGVALACWLLLAFILVFIGNVRIGQLRTVSDKVTPLHQAVASDTLRKAPVLTLERGLQNLAYTFALMFTLPDLGLRPAEPISTAARGYLLFVRAVGLVLLALLALTLAKVSPVIQAVIGKIAG